MSTPHGWEVDTTLPARDGQYAFLRLEAYASRAREFVAAIRERRPPCVPPQKGLSALASVEAAHRSAAEGVWVPVAQVGAG